MTTRHAYRDARGQFARVPTELARDERSERFPQTDSIDVAFPSDVTDSPYELVPDDRNVIARPVAPSVSDDLGVDGSPLRARNPRLVPQTEHATTIYGDHAQGAVGRLAASRGPRDAIPGTDTPADPSRTLTGAE